MPWPWQVPQYRKRLARSEAHNAILQAERDHVQDLLDVRNLQYEAVWTRSEHLAQEVEELRDGDR